MKKILIIILVSLLISLISIFVVYFTTFSSPQPNNSQVFTFIVPLNSQDSQSVGRLNSEGFIRSIWMFNFLRKIKGWSEIPPGGYNLSKNLNVWQIANELTVQEPDLVWITIPEGLRKEQIGERFAEILGWTEQELSDWNTVYTRMQFDYREGVYFPDTYLVKAHEKNYEVAQRMISHFNEVFSPYIGEFSDQDILWTTGLKVASLIERETADPADMPIISGIIWNRLIQGMRLQIDATLQYAQGKQNGKWWAPVDPQNKNLDSPYNTYLYEGLPPTPICNPGLSAIKAAANPAETDCLFYLHDNSGVMHCSVTYEQHLQNIENYLR